MVGFQGDNHSRYRRETDDSELLDNGYMKDFSEIVKRSSGDGSEGLVAALGVGIAVIIAFVVLIYAVLIVKLWASVNLLNGTKKVSLFQSFYQSAYLIY